MRRINRKIKGAATQRLFAAACATYCIQEAPMTNDPIPPDAAIFSFLSPQQRVRLVREVMIGVLCEDEPLPRDTIQHAAAYRALIRVLASMIEIEIYESNEFNDLRPALLLSDGEKRSPITPQDMEDNARKAALLGARARRAKKKLGKGHIENMSQRTHRSIDELQALVEEMRGILFTGDQTPLKVIRKLRKSLTKDEQCTFYWRILVYDSIKEQMEVVIPTLPPLANACVDFRSCCLPKWLKAIEIILITTFNNGGGHSPTERAMLTQPITMSSYADPSSLGLIQFAEENTRLLRAVFDQSWDPESVGDDQRCVFAVCSDSLYCQERHRPWLDDFLVRAATRGIDITRRGNYQQRYEIYKEMRDCHLGECMKYDLNDGENCWDHPLEYSVCDNTKPVCRRFLHMQCNGSTLKRCSGCGVVYYCSKECQQKDWNNHKNECKLLARTAEDKEKMTQIAQKWSTNLE